MILILKYDAYRGEMSKEDRESIMYLWTQKINVVKELPLSNQLEY